MSKAAMDNDIGDALGLNKRLSAVQGCRSVKKHDMVLNHYLPKMQIDAQTYQVRADGQLLSCEPATLLPLAQKYFLF
jgi:urease subunit alpha